MAVSLLNNAIKYRVPEESIRIGKVDSYDRGHRASLYEIQLAITGKRYLIALGKPRYNYAGSYDIVYALVYIMKKKKVLGSIGLYEVNKHAFTSLLDEHNELILNGMTPLLYPGITDEFLEKLDAEFEGDQSLEDEDDTTTKVVTTTDIMDETEDVFEPPQTASILKVVDANANLGNKKNTGKGEEMEGDRLTIHNVFVKDDPLPTRIPPDYQTIKTQHTLSKQARDEYMKTVSDSDSWIQKYMQNKHYKIIGNSGGGDCFFLLLITAFEELGYHTTVAKLRRIIAQEVNQNLFNGYRNMYSEFQDSLETSEREMAKLKQTNRELQKAITRASKEESKRILENANKLKAEYEAIKTVYNKTKTNLTEFKFMRHITTLDEFRKYIQTSDYWADTWAISTIERLLMVKIVILQESKDRDDVIRCGQLNDEMTVHKPTHYIIVDYSKTDDHFQLIAVDTRRIFTFTELPFDIKMLVVNKCMESAAGQYYIIPDFKQFQQELGIPEERSKEGNDMDTTDNANVESLMEGINKDDLFDSTILFRFHVESDGSKNPGDVNGEKLPKKRVGEFAELAKRDNWRQQLDDDWTGAPFMLGTTASTEGKLRWASVTHYLSAYALQETDPDAFVTFSLNSGTSLSKSATAARESVTKKGKKEGKYYKQIEAIREKDPDAFDSTLQDARKRALFAKFTQNADMTTILSLTKQAKLLHFVRGQEPETDILLMLIRKKVAKDL